MKTKEAIYFLENNVEDLGMPTPVVNERVKDVISLLWRGEKFEKILKVIEDELGEYALTIHTPTKYFPLRYASICEDRRNLIKIFIKEIKQKYFPEPKVELVELVKKIDKERKDRFYELEEKFEERKKNLFVK